MSLVSSPVIFVVESSRDDEMLTRRMLLRLGIDLEIRVERAGDTAINVYRTWFLKSPPSLVIVSDRLMRLDVHELVEAIRGIHSGEVVPILHLLTSADFAPAVGANAAIVKPVDYDEYLTQVGEAARELIST